MNRTQLVLSDIDVTGRIRKDYKDLPELMESILKHGLIQPVVVTPNNKLIVGGRRYYAHAALVELGHSQFNFIDVNYKEVLDEADLREMELEENMKRADMTWQEYCLGILEIHTLKTQKAVLAGEEWTQALTGVAVGKSRQRVIQILPVARALKADPNSPIWKCNDTTDATNMMLQMAEDRMKAALAAMSLKGGLQLTTPGTLSNSNTPSADSASLALAGKFMQMTVGGPALPTPLSHLGLGSSVIANEKLMLGVSTNGPANAPALPVPATPVAQPELLIDLAEYFHHGHCIPWMLQNKGSFDHIITDPPYAIDMDNLQQENTGMDVSRTREEHEMMENLELLRDFVPAAFQTLPDKGFLVMFCDAMNFRFLHDLGVKAGFAVQRWPVMWIKPQMGNQAAGFNFTKCTEEAIVMRKQGSTLVEHQATNWKIISKGPLDKDFDHPFAKPAELWDWFIKAVSSPGQTILDAFTGSGSGVSPCIRAGRQWRACEKGSQHVMEFLRNTTKTYTEVFATQKLTVNIQYNPPQLPDQPILPNEYLPSETGQV